MNEEVIERNEWMLYCSAWRTSRYSPWFVSGDWINDIKDVTHEQGIKGGPQEMCGIASTPEENRTRKGESKYLIVEHEADARVALLSPVPEVR